MDPINPLSGLTELIRRRAISETASSRTGRTPSQAKASTRTLMGNRAGLEELQREISGALEGVDFSDPSARQKGVRVFVETVLVWQFGNGVLNDPGFVTLIDEVRETLEKDPSTMETLGSLANGSSRG